MGKTAQHNLSRPISRFDLRRQQIGALGLDAYEVGGSVRDELLGKEAKDLDVAVCGLEPVELLEKLQEAGRAEPLEVAGQLIGARLYAPWTGPEGIEFALARTEVSIGGGHRDFSIITGPNIPIEEDLARRDFTINALARAINTDGSLGELIDPHNGQADLEAGRLRMLGPRTIDEDPLRILRGLVRVAKDGLDIEPGTAAAMSSRSEKISALSAERVFSELQGIINAPNGAASLRQARDLGLYQAVLPELAPTIGFEQQSKYHDLTVDQHCLLALERAEQLGAGEAVRWAALLHDSGKPATAWKGMDGRLHYYANPDDPHSLAHEQAGEVIARATLRRLKAPRQLEEKVAVLVREHMYGESRDFEKRSELRNAIKARRMIHRVGRDNVEELLLLRRCDHLAKSEQAQFGDMSGFENFEALIHEQIEAPLAVNELAISGHDLMELGLRGPAIGAAQKDLLRRVIDQPEANNRQQLLRWAQAFSNGSQ
jgi:tRNA nucleotidyltransferase (CCA-adding enzyme)